MANNKHDSRKNLAVKSEVCATAHQRPNGWDLSKKIITCDGSKDKIKICLFEQDSAIISYELKAKRKDNSILVMWPVIVYNNGCDATKDLRVGFSLSVHGGNNYTFKGFEDDYPVIEAGCHHRYVLTGTVPCVGKAKKLTVSTKDLVYDCDSVACAACSETIISDEICEEEYTLKDDFLNFRKCIKTDTCEIIRAEYTMDDNVVDDDVIVNCAEIIGNNCDVVLAKDKAKIAFNKACVELFLECDELFQTPQWCLCHTSDISDKNGSQTINYCADVSVGGGSCKNTVSLCLKLCINGCIPHYSKKFTINVFAIVDNCDKHQLLKKEDVHLGNNDKECILNKIEFERPKGLKALLITVTTNPVEILVAEDKVNCKKDCNVNVVDKKWVSKGHTDDVCLTNELCIPFGLSYKVTDRGTFSTLDDANDWVNGRSIKLHTLTKHGSSNIKWGITFHGEGDVKNIVNLSAERSKIAAETHEHICSDKHNKHTKDNNHDKDDKHDRHDKHDKNDKRHNNNHIIRPDRRRNNDNYKDRDDWKNEYHTHGDNCECDSCKKDKEYNHGGNSSSRDSWYNDYDKKGGCKDGGCKDGGCKDKGCKDGGCKDKGCKDGECNEGRYKRKPIDDSSWCTDCTPRFIDVDNKYKKRNDSDDEEYDEWSAGVIGYKGKKGKDDCGKCNSVGKGCDCKRENGYVYIY